MPKFCTAGPVRAQWKEHYSPLWRFSRRARKMAAQHWVEGGERGGEGECSRNCVCILTNLKNLITYLFSLSIYFTSQQIIFYEILMLIMHFDFQEMAILTETDEDKRLNMQIELIEITCTARKRKFAAMEWVIIFPYIVWQIVIQAKIRILLSYIFPVSSGVSSWSNWFPPGLLTRPSRNCWRRWRVGMRRW